MQRIACHIQVFALSKWLAVTFPVEYYEFVRGLQWSIPHINLPWETGHVDSVMASSTSPVMTHPTSSLSGSRELVVDASLYGMPLSPMEYSSFFEVRGPPFLFMLFYCLKLLYSHIDGHLILLLQSQNMKPEADFILDSQTSNG